MKSSTLTTTSILILFLLSAPGALAQTNTGANVAQSQFLLENEVPDPPQPYDKDGNYVGEMVWYIPAKYIAATTYPDVNRYTESQFLKYVSEQITKVRQSMNKGFDMRIGQCRSKVKKLLSFKKTEMFDKCQDPSFYNKHFSKGTVIERCRLVFAEVSQLYDSSKHDAMADRVLDIPPVVDQKILGEFYTSVDKLYAIYRNPSTLSDSAHPWIEAERKYAKRRMLTGREQFVHDIHQDLMDNLDHTSSGRTIPNPHDGDLEPRLTETGIWHRFLGADLPAHPPCSSGLESENVEAAQHQARCIIDATAGSIEQMCQVSQDEQKELNALFDDRIVPKLTDYTEADPTRASIEKWSKLFQSSDQTDVVGMESEAILKLSGGSVILPAQVASQTKAVPIR